jgi:hypothetical protein
MPPALLLPTRTATARRRSACSLCDGRIVPGEAIALVPARGWLHARCIAVHRPVWRGRPVAVVPVAGGRL